MVKKKDKFGFSFSGGNVLTYDKSICGRWPENRNAVLMNSEPYRDLHENDTVVFKRMKDIWGSRHICRIYTLRAITRR